MANPRDYPITCPFGWVKDYPLNQTDPAGHPGQGFHNGIDYGYPYGTPVIVNGVQIGLSGDTGAPGQPHCHVGKWIGGQVQNPGEYNGFTFQSAVVTEIHEVNDSVNGKYVRMQADGASWVYLHLSRVDVQVNQVLKGDEMFEGKSAQEWAIQAKDAEQYKQQVIKTTAWTRGMGMKVGNVQFIVDDLQKFKDDTIANPPKPPGTVTLKQGIYEVK